jgi:hypothetical protein
MSVNLPTHYVVSYSSNINLLLQEKGSKLRPFVTEGHYVGKQASPVDQFGAIDMQPVTGRFGPMGRVDAATDRRWVFPSDFDLPQLIDTFDKLRLLTDPESTYVQNAVFAAGRQMDRLILLAALGTAKTGEAGATSTSFTAGNEVDVATGGSNTRLNVAKLVAMQELMLANSVDLEMETPIIPLTAKDNSALMNEVQIISSDFNGGERPVLKDGRIRHFMGFDFVYCQLNETVNAGTSECNVPCWVKSGMHLGIWNDVSTSISKRHDLQSEPWQAYVYLTAGATRIEENRVYNFESYR